MVDGCTATDVVAGDVVLGPAGGPPPGHRADARVEEPVAGAAATGHGDVNAEAGSERAGEPAIPFTYALRGYDRRQVDEAFSTLLAQLTAERQRVIAVQAELSAIALGPGGAAANVAAVAGPDAAEGGPGNRMDTMLRAAEHEARELRDEARSVLAQAAAEAAAKREKLRADRMQHESAWAAADRQVEAIRAAADRHARVVIADAERDAQRLRDDARDEAQQLVTQIQSEAEAAAAALLERAGAQAQRLKATRARVRDELDRLLRALAGAHDALAYELGGDEPGRAMDSAGSGWQAGDAVAPPDPRIPGIRLGRQRKITIEAAVPPEDLRRTPSADFIHPTSESRAGEPTG